MKSKLSKVEILRISGERESYETPHRGSALLRWVSAKIGASSTDNVNLRDAQGRLTGQVMIVDDNGWATETIRHPTRVEVKPLYALKPVNPEATKLYHAQCQPGTTHQIAGDVAICNDEDFA